MDKIKISEAQLRQMFREEGGKIKKEIILKAMLNKIDSELKELDEVHAGGDMNPGKDGVHSGQKKPVFTKKGTHLVEDEMEMGDDTGMEGQEMDAPAENMGSEVSKEAVVDALQNLANSLNLSANIEIVSDEEAAMGEPEGGDVDLDVDVETGADDAVAEEPAEEESSEEESEEEESVDELRSVASEEQAPTEQRSVVSETPEAVQESAQDSAKKQRLTEEANRWKFLAGLK